MEERAEGMTDEEMAKNYAYNVSGLEITCSLLSVDDKSHAYRLGRYDGFLNGLNEGRPKWHDLRKDSDDLPKENMKQVIVKTSDGDKYMGWYCTHQGKWWHDECPDPDDEISDVIEWCEMP